MRLDFLRRDELKRAFGQFATLIYPSLAQSLELVSLPLVLLLGDLLAILSSEDFKERNLGGAGVGMSHCLEAYLASAPRLRIHPSATPTLEELRCSRLPRRSSPPAMALCLAPLLVLLLAGCGAMEEQRAPGFQGCRQTLNMSVLGALPGGGWDNLRNVELGLVLRRDYWQCLTTEDGEYLIPDRVQVVLRRESIVETRAGLIDHWVNYTDTWAASINTELSFLPNLNGQFSVDCQNVRKYSLEYQTVTTRGQTRHGIYSVKAPENPDFQPDFLRHLLTLSDHLENNQTREAEYLAEMLVLRYGTHVLTDVEAGAALVQEYQVRRELVDSEARDKINITYAASALFFHAVNAGDGVSWQVQSRLLQNYGRNTVVSKMHSHGGVPFYPGITLQKWQEGIGNRLVAVRRSGPPLLVLLQLEALPELPEARVAAANVDDGSCRGRCRGGCCRCFGAVFQECEAVSGRHADHLCRAYRVPNPLTGKASCPANYTASARSGGLKTWSEAGPECRQHCRRCWLFFRCCSTVCATHEPRNAVSLAASWCAPSGASLPASAGLLFGGLYSPGNPNPLTGSQACPSHFYPLTLFGDLKVCVSSDSELGTAQAVPFGGFFSCQAGNPLAGLVKDQSPGLMKEVFYRDSPTDFPMKCPAGYSQHQAYLSDGCQILYCLRAGALLDQQQAAVRMPPFIPRPPLLNRSSTHRLSVLVDSSGQRVWVRLQGSDHWQQANINDPSLSAKLLSQAGLGPSVGAIVGSWVGATVALVALALGVSCGFRFYKKGGYRRLQEGILTEEQRAYGATETTENPARSECMQNDKNAV
ncbi:macrophage-expressed gene 1 protein-like [Mesoplodon densirostris]|uniref:macrophage-expressed gene 1 protein-like n=1 Tax=Mesoplodon densirostris TaxID=48708 RepID=UPI0028DC4CAB|nr:macrophage-expressed gene 1 protein-like [Mesoplodon densirostris]